MLDTSSALPSTPDEITPAWLAHALSIEHPGITVTSLETTRIIWGAATKVMLEVTYAGPGADELPRQLCVKAGLDRRLDAVSDDAIHLTEALFYGDLRHRFETSAPRSYYAATDAEGRTGLIILEDLAAQGAVFVDPGEALTPDQVADGLTHQATWHAVTWGATPETLPGVRVGSITRQAAKLFFRQDYWDRHFAQPEVPHYPDRLDDPELLKRVFRGLWAHDDARVHCFLHGDAHVGNTYLRAGGGLGFIDWQCYGLGPWSYDVAYFVSGALTVADRRASEIDLLRHYLDVLAAQGGPRLDFDEAWRDYANHLVHGLIWTMTPTLMQPIERTQTMSERHVTAVEDHDAVFGSGLLGAASAR
ncbi:MAG: phosphotransferase [Nocardioides sp.]|uniref:phosphotransferase n=1 Tax=Nocardioides sp. TaxID=35761 RepID=UPI0039E3A246